MSGIVNPTGLTTEELAKRSKQKLDEKLKSSIDRLKEKENINKDSFALEESRLDPKTFADASAANIAKQDGYGGGHLIEPFAKFDSAPSDKVISGENNTWLVLGRDNPSNKSGLSWGSIGVHRAGAIDLFAGIGGTNTKTTEFVGKNFVHDSTRLYLSMKANIDNYLLIPSKTTRSLNSIGRSCALLIADDARMVGRHSVKIIAGSPTNFNSNGKTIKPLPSIALMGNYDETNLQPIVKGENLKSFLSEVTEAIKALNSQVANIVKTQNEYNLALANHFHASNIQMSGVPQFTSIPANLGGLPASTAKIYIGEIKGSLTTQLANIETSEAKYLKRFQDSINSTSILSDTVFAT